MARYINPYTDFGFKKVFGEEANKDLLVDFLNQLLQEPIFEKAFKTAEVANMSPEQRDEYEQSRLSYLEVKEAVSTAEMDGRKKREHEIAREMKAAGEPVSKISQYTGLNSQEIERL